MKAFFAAKDQTKKDEIAAPQLHALRNVNRLRMLTQPGSKFSKS